MRTDATNVASAFGDAEVIAKGLALVTLTGWAQKASPFRSVTGQRYDGMAAFRFPVGLYPAIRGPRNVGSMDRSSEGDDGRGRAVAQPLFFLLTTPCCRIVGQLFAAAHGMM